MFMHSAFCYNSAFKLWEAGPRSAETKVMKKMAVVQDFKMATPIRVLDDDVFHITEEMDMI